MAVGYILLAWAYKSLNQQKCEPVCVVCGVLR